VGGQSSSAGGTGGTAAGTSSGGGSPCTPGETSVCYSGPDGTVDVGTCMAGVATCEADGTFGPCLGEVVPAADDCETIDDEDCSGANESCTGPGSAAWTVILGGSAANTVGFGVPRIDPTGDILSTLSSAEALSLGNGVTTATGTNLVRYDQSGVAQWSTGWSPPQGPIDPGPIEFLVLSKHEAGLLNIASTFPIAIHEHELDGTSRDLWDVGTAHDNPGSPDTCFAFRYETAVQPNPHELSLAGIYRGTVTLAGQTINKGSFDHDVVYARLSTPSTPTALFLETIQATDAGQLSMATRSDGDMYLSFEAQGPLSHGGTSLTSDTGRGYLVARVDGMSGAIVWSKWLAMSGIGNVGCGAALRDLVVLPDGTFVVAFINPYDLDVDGTLLSGQLALAHFDADGNVQWTVDVPKVVDMNPSSISGDLHAGDDGSIVWAGNMNGVFDFGGGPVGVWSANYDTKGIVVKYDASTGAFSWQRVFDYADGGLQGAILAPGGAVIVSGSFKQSLTFSGQQFPAPSQYATWLTKLVP